MAKRPDNLETVLLALELLRHIPRTRKISTGELQRRLAGIGIERDIRTIQRQLNVLSAHFAIECDDTNKPYGYRWAKDAKGLALPVLSEQESLLLRLAELHLKLLLPAATMKSLEGFFKQARANLEGPSPHAARREREWLAKVRTVSTSQPLLPPALHPGVFEQVSDALYANRWLEITYRSFSGNTADAQVMPLGLAQQGPRLYLVCRYRDFDNERTLAMHRILRAAATTENFQRPRDFDLDTYQADGRFSFGEGRKIRLSFMIDENMGTILEESPLSKDQTAVRQGNHFKITATVVESVLLERWLLSYGKEISSIRRTPV